MEIRIMEVLLYVHSYRTEKSVPILIPIPIPIHIAMYLGILRNKNMLFKSLNVVRRYVSESNRATFSIFATIHKNLFAY